MLLAKASDWEQWSVETQLKYIKDTFEKDEQARKQLAQFTRNVMNLTDTKPTQTDKVFVLVVVSIQLKSI